MATVALSRCGVYDLETIRQVLSRSMEQMGGWSAYVKPGETVLLKVNLLMRRAPETATTTHPVFVEALATLLAEQGCQVIIGDSPAGPYNAWMLSTVYKGSGYDRLHRPEEGIRLNDDFGECDVHREDLKLLRQLTVIGILEKVDKVISVSKLKTHGMTVFTGAVKNMFGTIPGGLKAEYHFKMPLIEDFTNMLVDVCLNAAPVLSFMDGIVGMEGAGPSAGDPVSVGAVLVSDSPYHLDQVACALVGIPQEAVPTIRRCVERGLVTEDLSDIVMTDLSVEDFGMRAISHPQAGGISLLKGKLPGLILRPLSNLLNPKPVFSEELCVRCGRCVEACPPDALTLEGMIPEVDLSKCIRCFCCQELCPHRAVSIHRNPIAKWIVKL